MIAILYVDDYEIIIQNFRIDVDSRYNLIKSFSLTGFF